MWPLRRSLRAKITTKKVSINKIFIFTILKNMIFECFGDFIKRYILRLLAGRDSYLNISASIT